jgi:hypothetical protein
LNSKRNLHVRLERLEEALALKSGALDSVIEYDENTTPEQIAFMEAEHAATGTRVFVLESKDGGMGELHLWVPENAAELIDLRKKPRRQT